MKSIAFTKYGSPDFLKLIDIEIPTPSDHEVLIKINTASINSWDWELLKGEPFANRTMFGLFKPTKLKTLGADIAGRVVSIGNKVQMFSQGDEVLGDLSACLWGGFAEYVCVNENAVSPKLNSITFEQAAAIPQAGVLALQALHHKKQVQPGQTVLINGAGGGVGTFAIQIAKNCGAIVTGVDHTKKMDAMRAIGADHVIDYTKEDFIHNGQRYDFILDNAATRSVFSIKRALNPEGIYTIIGGQMGRILQFVLLGPAIAKNGQKMGILLHKPDLKDDNFIQEQVASGKIAPVIDRVYPLNEVPEAIQYFGEGLVKGKIIIKCED